MSSSIFSYIIYQEIKPLSTDNQGSKILEALSISFGMRLSTNMNSLILSTNQVNVYTIGMAQKFTLVVVEYIEWSSWG